MTSRFTVPSSRLRRDDDEVAVQAHVEAVVLADVRVVPVDTGVRELDAVGELAADRDRCLGLVGHAVVPVVESEPVPVDGGLDVGVVADTDVDLGSLVTRSVGPGIDPL